MSETLSKSSMRHEAMLHRDRIDPRTESAEDAARLFLDHLQPTPGDVIALYWPKGREFDTLPLLHELLSAGHVCALPVVERGAKVLKFARWAEDDPLEQGAFGLMQPVKPNWVDPDLIIVPLLAFDKRGHRLGYGQGYYDATLRHYRDMKPVVAVGYAYAQQAVLFALPTDPHDEKLDWIVTPQKAERFT